MLDYSNRIDSPSNQPRILVVDDDYDAAITFKIGLENNGFKVDMFTDPLEALSHFRAGYYHLLLVDIRMATMSGFQLYSRIIKVDSKIKVCFTTAFVEYYNSLRQ